MDQDDATAGGVGGGKAQDEPDVMTQKFTTNTATGTETTFGSKPPESRPLVRQYTEHVPKINTGEKKSRTGLIIASIVSVIVLLIGGIAIWFFAFFNSPERVAYEAIHHLLTSEHVAVNGGFSILPDDDTDSPFQMLTLNINSSATDLPNSTEATLLIAFKGEKADNSDASTIKLKLNTIQMRDGVLYLRVSGIIDSLKTFGVSDEELAEAGSFFSTLELIDNEWWQISVPDVVDSMELDSEMDGAIKDVYACSVEALNQDTSGEIAQLYHENRFMRVTKTDRRRESPDGSAYSEPEKGYNLYEATLDPVLLANFVNGLVNISSAQGFVDCYNDVMRKYGAEEDMLSIEDNITESDPDDFTFLTENFYIYLEISKWSHELRSITFYANNDQYGDMQYYAGFLFTYEATVVETPESYRPVTELIDELSEAAGEVLGGAGDLYYHSLGYDQLCYCLDSIDVPCDCPPENYYSVYDYEEDEEWDY